MSLFRTFDPSQPQGMFGYAGHCCDTAIRLDRADMAKECWERGWMDASTRMLSGDVIDECDRRAPKVAEMLRGLGPVRVEPEMVPPVVVAAA